jgi:hypothetical protein
MADIAAFMENPVLGVGPGKSSEYHVETVGRAAVPHTEFSRLPAEHGSFGLVAVLLLVGMSWPRFIRRRGRSCNTVYSAAFTAWALAFMAYESMRLAAVGFLFGLASAVILSQRDLLVLRLKAQQQEITQRQETTLYAGDEWLISPAPGASERNSLPGYEGV